MSANKREVILNQFLNNCVDLMQNYLNKKWLKLKIRFDEIIFQVKQSNQILNFQNPLLIYCSR